MSTSAESTTTAARSRIAQLDLEIADLQRSIDKRLAEREEWNEVLNSYKYPVLTLPVEITADIFTKFLPAHPERPLLAGPDSPSLLLQVCRQWHDVALATPELWSTMKLDLEDQRTYAHQCLVLEKWLQRSGISPLSLELVFPDGMGGTPAVAEFVQTILPHASRWREVELCLPFVYFEQMIGPMPMLHSLKVGPTQILPPFPRPSAPPTAICMEAPNLKEVTLSMWFNPLWIALPWSQITTIEGAQLYVNEAMVILRNTVALERCNLTIVGDADPTTIPTPMPLIRLPSLRSLTMLWHGRVSDNMDNLYTFFFKALSLPALESIRVSEYLLGEEPIAALSLLRPDGHIAEIRIIHAETSEEEYSAAFPDAKLSVDAPDDESGDGSSDEYYD
ncbi:hypothetical protein FB45DRAFT_901355 [Roridomyces roridus]|uniref:F-box domain-containing protein n=1 Tax=Roridomyces roridus TaxID=1738132 RepID=A0AAD7C8U5_9AGAR|nr:hypothetical protein FB45DRAFT_901355 [Roridomyces roridus]